MKRTFGKFKIGDDGELIFSPDHATADLELDEILCGQCCNIVDVDHVLWED